MNKEKEKNGLLMMEWKMGEKKVKMGKLNLNNEQEILRRWKTFSMGQEEKCIDEASVDDDELWVAEVHICLFHVCMLKIFPALMKFSWVHVREKHTKEKFKGL